MTTLAALLRPPAPCARTTSLRALVKYSESQERDERGRFAGGGSSSESKVSPSSIPRSAPGALNAHQVGIETRFANQLARDMPGAMAAYARLPDSAGGKVLNTDVVRELSPEYRNDRSQAAAVHEPASHLTRQMYAQKLAETPVSNTVLFTAGGAGSGKSSGIKAVPEMSGLNDRADVIYDTTMNKFGSAKEKIDQALASGRNVHIAYVARDPVESLVLGALPRAMGTGGGRTVPLSEHINTHVGAAQTVQKLAEHYGDNPRVAIHYIDNTKGRGGATLADKPPALNFDKLSERLGAALKAEHEAGRISTKVFEGTKGQNVPAHA